MTIFVTPTSSLDVELQQAVAYHKAGQLPDAERIYRAILQVQPNHPDANHNLGVLAGQAGQYLAGLPYLRTALQIRPAEGQYALSYAEALLATGQAREALNILQNAMQHGLNTQAAQFLRHQAEAAVGGELPQEERDHLVALFNAGRHAELEARVRLVVEQYPDSGFAWTVLGVSLHVQGKEALPALQKATQLSPDDASAHNNLGNALRDRGQLDGAVASCRRAIEIKPDFAEAHNNLGNALQDLGQLEGAVASYHQALELRIDYAEALNNLGNALVALGRFDSAVANFRRALEIKPDYAEVYGGLGGALKAQNKLDEALACFQQQIRLTPGNTAAQHQIASLTGTNTERAPNEYIESLFDSYAEKFDTHLQEGLKYDAPRQLVELVLRHSRPPAERWNVLDLGCGTGLVGPAIAPFAQQLVGVDLSAKMLEKAHKRDLYQRLERSDLLTMMRSETASSYDVIIAADVFVYLGKLDEIISEVKRLLCPGGVLAFSIEGPVALSNEEASQDSQRDYQLEKTGRYTHFPNYIARLAAANGFLTEEMTPTQIRIEKGKPVNSYLALWKSCVSRA